MNSTIPSGFVKSVLQNGVGRFVCQLQRVTIKFCKAQGPSKGVREFIETDLVDFARKNPGTVILVVNGKTDYISCHNFTKAEVVKHMDYLLCKSGIPIVRLRKFGHTDSPSIQGIWTPFDRIDPAMNIKSFPDDSLTAVRHELSATEVLKNLAENAKRDQPIKYDEQN
ncbi:39S ribosomal protein L43, mitochondrial [Chamberlinius hualienensis]